MTDFTPITTQEEFDARLQDRLQRHRNSIEKELSEKYSKEFSDYDELKKLADNSKAQIEDLNKQIENLSNSKSDYESQIKGLKQTVNSFELEKTKTEIALKKGLPYDLAQRLVGENEKELREDAERLSELIGSQNQSSHRVNREPDIHGDSIDNGFRQLLSNFNNRGE